MFVGFLSTAPARRVKRIRRTAPAIRMRETKARGAPMMLSEDVFSYWRGKTAHEASLRWRSVVARREAIGVSAESHWKSK